MGNSCSVWWHNKISFFEHYLVIIFRKWGYFVAHRPLSVIIGSLVLAVIMCIGMLFIESESETLELYVPKNSISYNNHLRYSSTWKKYQDDINFQSIQVTATDNNDLTSQTNIFTAEYLTELLRIHNLIMDIKIDYQDSTYQFDDICYHYENGNCMISSILEFYDFNETLINNAFIDLNSNPIIYPSQFSFYSETNVFMVLILGQNITLNDENNHIIATPAFSIRYLCDATLFDSELILEWEHTFQSLMQNEANSNKYFYITMQTENSFNEELSRAIGSDIASFIISFALIGIFASFILLRFKKNKSGKLFKYKIDSLRNRSQLSIMGIISTILAIFSSFGIVGGLFHIKWNPIVSVSPFLLVGLGVDDMFVLLRAYELTDSKLSIPDRIALTMERGGISILFTSITDLVAFCVGSTSSFGSVSAFCLYCGVGVFMDFLFQITFFLGMMVYDSRVDTCCICCVCNKKSNKEVLETPEKTADITTTNLEVKDIDLNDANILLSYMINNEASSVLMKNLGNLIIGNNIFIKILIIFIFIGYLIGATFGMMQLHAYQDPVDLVPADSYLTEHLNLYEIYFDQIGQPLQIIFDKHLDYSQNDTFNTINSLVIELRKDKCFESQIYLTNSWIHSFRSYLKNNYGTTDINSTLFYEILYLEYLVSEYGESYIDDIWNTIIINDNDNTIFNRETIGKYSYKYINSSRITMNLVPGGGFSTEAVADCLDTFKTKIMKNYKDDLNPYYYLYITAIAESDLVTIEQTIRSLCYAMIAACIITIILIPYPLMTIFVMTTVGQILFGVLGYMSLWGLPINATTMINVVMSVGFSVDNAAHFCHAFINTPIENIPNKLSNKQERNARVLFALNSVGMPILAGDLSTIVALLPLAASNTEIFISFWKCISLVMMFGAGYAVLYLPLVLSFCGPIGIQQQINNNNTVSQLEMQQQMNKETTNNNDIENESDKLTQNQHKGNHKSIENKSENDNESKNENDNENKSENDNENKSENDNENKSENDNENKQQQEEDNQNMYKE